MHTPQPEQESIFRTFFAWWLRFGGIFRWFLRATTKKVHPRDKILATPMFFLKKNCRPVFSNRPVKPNSERSTQLNSTQLNSMFGTSPTGKKLSDFQYFQLSWIELSCKLIQSARCALIYLTTQLNCQLSWVELSWVELSRALWIVL